MAQDKNTPPPILDGIKERAPDVYEQYLRPNLTPPSWLTENQGGAENLKLRSNGLGNLLPSAGSAGALVLRALSTSLKRVVRTAANVIRGFWSSTTSTRASRNTTLPLLSRVVMPGRVKYYDGKSANAVYSVPTATGNIPLSNKTTTRTQMFEPLSVGSTEITTSPSDFARIRDELIAGTLDLDSITLKEYLDVSFLSLFDKLEVNSDHRVFYQGNIYQLHACVTGVVPNQPVEDLRKTQ
jgi:hypothetical protein